MAMGGSHKGNSGGSRRKPYFMMLLLAFGAALLGVMVIHKLRERRIFNLFVKEKDHELISLHLLLQKEQEYSKEMKRKNAEMKAKIYSLRTQKMETDRRILEMQSTIDSLIDEQKIMESALEEKQNDIRIHRETDTDPGKENSQMKALMESLKQKESEIEYLKRHFKNPLKIWSVSSDDPSNRQTNLNMTINLGRKGKTEDKESKLEDAQLHESTNYSEDANSSIDDGSNDTSTLRKGENTARYESRSEGKVGSINRKEAAGEELLKMLESSLEGLRNGGGVGKKNLDNGQENKMEPFPDISASGTKTSVGIVTAGGKGSQTGFADNDTNAVDSEQHEAAEDEKPEFASSEQETVQDQGTFKDGVKLEMTDNSRSSSTKVKAKRAKGKRWRILARNRRLENLNKNSKSKGTEGVSTRKVSTNYQDGLIEKGAAAAFDEGKTDSEGAIPLEVAKAKDLSSVMMDDIIYHSEKEHGMWKRPQISRNGEALTNVSFNGKVSNIKSNAKLRQYELREISRNDRNMNIQNSAERVNAVRRRQGSEDTSHDTDPATGDFYRESISDLEENNEDYKEETDDS